MGSRRMAGNLRRKRPQHIHATLVGRLWLIVAAFESIWRSMRAKSCIAINVTWFSKDNLTLIGTFKVSIMKTHLYVRYAQKYARITELFIHTWPNTMRTKNTNVKYVERSLSTNLW
jgi:hypothetical protein